MSSKTSQPPSKPVDFSKPIDVSNVRGQSALVTGGAVGIGEGIVRALAEAGAYVTVGDIDVQKGEKLAEELSGKGLHVQFVRTDATNWSDQLQLFTAAVSYAPSKTLDLVVPCAGRAEGRISQWLDNPPIDESTGALLPPSIKVLELNLIGVFYTTHLALHHFKTSSPSASGLASTTSCKQIIFMGSLASIGAQPLSSTYVASKFGVRGLWKSLRSSPTVLGEGKPLFRTSLICPTYILTPMTAPLTKILDRSGVHMGTVEDVVEGVMRVATDESIHGRALIIGPKKTVIDIADDGDNEMGKEFMAAANSGVFGPVFASFK